MATAGSSSAGEPREGRAALAVLGKDLRVEYRTRYAVCAIGLFAVTTLFAVSFSLNGRAAPEVQAALLWIVLYFAALSGLTRTFVAEEDGRTADQLRLSTSGTAVFLGKLAFNCLLLLALAIILVPGFMILMAAQPQDFGLLAATLATGCWGLAAVLTFTAALISQARARGALGAVVAFPLVAPLLPLAIGATTAALRGDGGAWPAVRALASYSGIMTVVAVLLFEAVWNA
jgi:heme exporter protein B